MGGHPAPSTVRSRVAAVLTGVLKADDPTSAPLAARVDPEALGLPELVQAADFHRVGPALHAALHKQATLSPHVRQSLRVEHHAQVFRHAAVLGNLAELARTLDALECRWAVVKGPYLAEVVHARPDLRSYIDLDVVVDHRMLPDVVEALLADGAELLDRNWTLIRAGGRAQTSLLLAMGTPLDLHWHLLNRGPIRQAFHLDMDGILERTRRVQVGSVQVPVLDHADALIHLCLHAVIAGGSRLVWLHDIHATMLRHGPDPDTLVRRAGACGAGLAVAVMLQRCRTALGTPIDDALLDALARRPGWRSLTALVDARRPVAENFGRVGTGRTLIRATRAGDLLSAREFQHTARRNTLARLRQGLGPSETAQGADVLDPLRQVGGTDRDRDAFFAWVAATANY